MIYQKSEYNEKPLAVDFSSSPTTVYLRRNIEQVEKEDPETKEVVLVWQADEATISKTDYIAILQSHQEETDEALQELILATFGGE